MVTFLGVVRLDFINQETGEQIRGYNFWFSEPAPEGSIGERPFKHFVSDRKAVEFFRGDLTNLSVHLGKPCTVVYNRYGKIDDIQFGKG